jgi:hypothetical protein
LHSSKAAAAAYRPFTTSKLFSFFQVSGGDWTTGALGCMASPGRSPTLLAASENTPEGLLQDLFSPPLQGWKKKVCFFFLETLAATG